MRNQRVITAAADLNGRTPIENGTTFSSHEACSTNRRRDSALCLKYAWLYREDIDDLARSYIT
jgi:hypothetical protein